MLSASSVSNIVVGVHLPGAPNYFSRVCIHFFEQETVLKLGWHLCDFWVGSTHLYGLFTYFILYPDNLAIPKKKKMFEKISERF